MEKHCRRFAARGERSKNEKPAQENDVFLHGTLAERPDSVPDNHRRSGGW